MDLVYKMKDIKIDNAVNDLVCMMNVNFERVEKNNAIFTRAILRLESEISELKKEIEDAKDTLEEMGEYMTVNES